MVLIPESDERVQTARAGFEAHRQDHVNGVPCPYPNCLISTPEGVEQATRMFLEHLQRLQDSGG